MAKKNEIAKAEADAIQPVEQIESLILTIRGKQAILDRDLARLYGVETKVLNQAVKRNVERNQLVLTTQVAENNKKLEKVFKRLDAGDAKPEHGIFFDGQIFDSYSFINDRIREAKKRIILIDNYIDDSVLKMLDKRAKGVTVKLYTNLSFGSLQMDLKKHNAQYAPIDAEQFNRSHDRWLCIDDTVYLVGASLKDLGKKWFGFSKMLKKYRPIPDVKLVIVSGNYCFQCPYWQAQDLH